MFGFTRHEMESTGSADRFPIRVENFRKKRKVLPVLQHGFWWFIHNCITHPLIGICPIKPLFQFHDWTSVKLTAGIPAITTEIEELEGYKEQLENIMKGVNKLNPTEEPYVSYVLEQAIVEIRRDIGVYRRNKKNK